MAQPLEDRLSTSHRFVVWMVCCEVTTALTLPFIAILGSYVSTVYVAFVMTSLEYLDWANNSAYQISDVGLLECVIDVPRNIISSSLRREGG